MKTSNLFTALMAVTVLASLGVIAVLFSADAASAAPALAMAGLAMAPAGGLVAPSGRPLTPRGHVPTPAGLMPAALAAHLANRPAAVRGSPRAETAPALAEVKTAVGELNAAFAAFKTANDERLKALEKGREDVVTNEKVDKVNAAVGELQASVDEMAKKVAAASLNGGGAPSQTPEAKAYAAAFETYFRKNRGAEALGELAVKAAMTTQSDPDGGFLVPAEMEAGIDRVLGTVSAMRELATVRSISRGAYRKLVNLGGTSSGWVGETGSRPQTDPSQLAGLEFPAMELYAMPAASQTLLDDAQVDIAAWLADEVSIEFAEQEGAAFISGTGVNQPRGLLSYDTVADASWAHKKIGFVVSGGAADFHADTPGDALIDLVYAVKSGYRNNARFLMNRKTAAKVRKFKDGQDNYLWQPSAQAGQPAQLLGYGVVDDDNMPDVGAGAFPVAFGDFRRGYLIVDRTGVRVLRDPFTAKPYVLFYTTKRVGGGVQNFEAIKLLKVST